MARFDAPSVPAGSHKMREFFSNQNPPRSVPYTTPTITPYLSLRARLSQVWINRWTVLLLLVLARTLIAIAGINEDLGSARTEALSACSEVESLGSAMASMPHYMSQGVNALTADGVEKSVNALMQTTTLAVTGVEELVVFMVNTMTSTYLCLITFAVTGSLQAVINVMENAQDQLNQMTQALGSDMSSTIGSFQTAYNNVKDDLSKATLGLGSGINLPTLDVTSDITKLQNLTLPSNLWSDLQTLNNSLPTFAQVQNFTDNVIRVPFDDIKQLINNSLGTYTFDQSVFPVPQKESLTFCSDDDGINDFFDELVKLANDARKIFIGILLVAAVLACVPMAYREIRRYRTMRERAQLVGSQDHDGMDVVYIVSRPYTATAGIKMSTAMAKSSRRQVLIRWIVAYATTEAALFVLCLAIAGLFSVLCQFILLKSLEKEVPDLTNQVSAFADKVIAKLDNASQSWADGGNKILTDTNNTINQDMLGWVNTSTVALNDTLNTFVNLTMNVLNSTFGGTPLYDPVLEVLNCLVLLKVAGIEKGLTWVHDNAHIDIPLLPDNMFSLGAVASIASGDTPGSTPTDGSFLSSPGDTASDKISGAVEKFIGKLENAVRTEAIISSIVLVVYIIVVLIGVGRAMMLWFGRDKLRGEGGAAPVISAPTPAMGPGITNFRSGNPDHFAQFHDIPLQSRPQTPVPNYATAMATKEVSRSQPHVRVSEDQQDDPFSDEKAHRNYGGSLNPRVPSQHASIWEADRKG